jgi:hypothetical protein
MDAYPFQFDSGELLMFTKISFGKILVSVLVSIFILIAATGCQSSAATTAVPLPVTGGQTEPTSTPKPMDQPATIIPNTLITLPDGSKIILRPGAKIEVLSQPGIPATSTSIVVKLIQGEIMALPNLDSKVLFSVQSSDGYGAQIQGCAMTVNIDTKSDSFEMKCIGGTCEIGANSANMVAAGANKVWKLISGILADPLAVDFKQLVLDYPDGLPACVAESELVIPQTGGSAPTTTPTLMATKSPTVVIPKTGGNSLSLTATAACETFHQQFPSTPCAP